MVGKIRPFLDAIPTFYKWIYKNIIFFLSTYLNFLIQRYFYVDFYCVIACSIKLIWDLVG